MSLTILATIAALADAGRAIDLNNSHNHRICIANGGLWDPAVVSPTTVPGHPNVGECSGGRKTNRTICPGMNLNTRCWKFVLDDGAKPTVRALPSWPACRSRPADPMC